MQPEQEQRREMASLVGPTVTIRTSPEGHLRIEKQFPSGTGASTGEDEAGWLARANHPGVVRLLFRDEAVGLNAMTHVSGPTLRTSGASPEDAAAILASVATTLADLHEAGLTHGAVHPDHILAPAIPDADRSSAILGILCSPSPTGLGDATADSHGLGRCVQWLVGEWTTTGRTVPPDWPKLAKRLTEPEPMTPRRAAQHFNRIAGGPRTDIPHRLPRSLVSRSTARRAAGTLAALGLAIALASTWLDGRNAPSAGQLRISSDGHVFAVGDIDDSVVVLPGRCPGQPAALLLRRATSNVWTFDHVENGATAHAMASVPGATALRVDAAVPCPRVWATGPSGEVELDWP